MKIRITLLTLVLALSLNACGSSGSMAPIQEVGDAAIELDTNIETQGTGPETEDAETQESVSDETEATENNDIVIGSNPPWMETGLSAETLITAYEIIKDTPLYISFGTGQNTGNNMCKNSIGESVQVSSNGEVVMIDKNNQSIYFGLENTSKFVDVDNIELIGFFINAYKEGYAELNSVDLSEKYDGVPVYYFIIDVYGYDNIRSLYNQLNSDYGEYMVDLYKSLSRQAGYNPSYEPVNLRLAVVIDNSGLCEAGLYSFFGDYSRDVPKGYKEDSDWAGCSTMWYFSNMWYIPDWHFNDAWYEFDFNSAIGENRIEEMEDLATENIDLANEVVEKFYNDNFVNTEDSD